MRIPEQRLDPPEPKTAAKCPVCGEDVYEGEDAVQFEDRFFHLECFQDEAASILIDRYGAVVCIA